VITAMQMYWIVILDNIIDGVVAVMVIAGACSLALTIATVMDELPEWFPIPPICVFFASILLLMFTPSTKQMAAILIVPRVVNNEKVQTVGNKLYDLAVEWMDGLKPKKEGAAHE